MTTSPTTTTLCLSDGEPVTLVQGTASFTTQVSSTVEEHGDTYYTHNNGGRPFKVVLRRDYSQAFVYERAKELGVYKDVPTHTFEFVRVFVGPSPLCRTTSFSGGAGPKFEGNSMLFELKEPVFSTQEAKTWTQDLSLPTQTPPFLHTYAFVGHTVFLFQTHGKIVEYSSPVGNSDVPYPWALDELGYIYLMLEHVVMTPREDRSVAAIPDREYYDYYYKARLLTADKGYLPAETPLLPNFKAIQDFLIGDEKFTLTYASHPSTDFDRLTSWTDVDLHGERWCEERGLDGSHRNTLTIKVIHIDGTSHVWTKEDYVACMTEFGRVMGFYAFPTCQC